MKVKESSQINVVVSNVEEPIEDVQAANFLTETRESSPVSLRAPKSRFSTILGVVAIAAFLFAVKCTSFSRLPLPTFETETSQLSLEGENFTFTSVMVWLGRRELSYQLMLALAVLVALLLGRRSLRKLMRKLEPSQQLLLAFVVIVLYFGCSAGIHYWHQISIAADKFYLGLGLFLTMVGGMFVQVITANYKAGADIFEINAAQLVYPLLFSPIVYYGIWAVAASSNAWVFSVYAAFLNGYFWQSVVAAARKALK